MIKNVQTLVIGLAVAALLFAGGAYPQDSMPKKDATGGDCGTCHRSETPSRDDLYPSNKCSRAHNPLAGKVPDSNTPDVILLDKLSDLYVPVVFPHRLHASMETMSDGCGFCHHHGEPGKIVACHECHNDTTNPKNLRQPGLKGAYHRQCLGCHRDWSHESDCIFCHAKRTPGTAPETKPDPTDMPGRLHPNVSVPDKRVFPTPEMDEGTMVTFRHKDHVELFGRKCADCHKQENCNRCHDPESAQKRVKQDPHQDCAKCHDVTGDCSQCHMKQESKGFDHGKRSKFMLKGFHQGLACSKCHTNDKTFAGLDPKCDTCHTGGWFPEKFDHARTGLVLDEAHKDNECRVCHGEKLGGEISCKACHDDNRKFPDKMPGAPATAAPAPAQAGALQVIQADAPSGPPPAAPEAPKP